MTAPGRLLAFHSLGQLGLDKVSLQTRSAKAAVTWNFGHFLARILESASASWILKLFFQLYSDLPLDPVCFSLKSQANSQMPIIYALSFV